MQLRRTHVLAGHPFAPRFVVCTAVTAAPHHLLSPRTQGLLPGSEYLQTHSIHNFEAVMRLSSRSSHVSLLGSVFGTSRPNGPWQS